MGYLYIEFSNQELINNSVQTRRLGIKIGIIGMAIIACLGLFMGYILTRKLEKITAAAKLFGEGNFDIKIGDMGSDEIGIMGDSLNRMQERIQSLIFDLKSKQDQLQEANNNLEIKVKERTSELLILNDKLKNSSEQDELTKLYNRRKFNTFIQDEFSRTNRAGTYFSVILIDVDYFKQYNDKYGHQKGDECLITIASAMRRCLSRSIDFIARYGGEEFIVVLPSTDVKGALKVAGYLRQAILNLKIPHALSDVSTYVTISQGLTVYNADNDSNIDDIIFNADKYLYLAKSNGRNRVEAMPLS